MNKKLAIIGAGGHGKVVGEIAFQINTRLLIFLMIEQEILNPIRLI